MLTIVPTINAPLTLRSLGAQDADWNIESIEDQRVISEADSSTAAVQDANITTHTGAEYATDLRISVNAFGVKSFRSLTPFIATVDQNGVVTIVAAGQASILVTVDRTTRRLDFTAVNPTGATVTTFDSFVASTVGKEASDFVDDALVGKSAATALKMFTSQNHGTQTYVRNPNLWRNSVVQNLTCCSPWNSTYGNLRAGTLFTPQHFYYSPHFPPAEGSTMRFVGADGTVYNRTVLKRRSHPDYDGFFPDLGVGVLSSPLPVAITPCKFAPSDFEDYIPGVAYGIPCIILDQAENLSVTDLFHIDFSASFIVPKDSKRLEFYEPKINGDSGNPAFMVIDEQLVLMTTLRSGGAGSGPFAGDHLAAINQLILDVDALASISTGYTLTEVDLSDFTNFAEPEYFLDTFPNASAALSTRVLSSDFVSSNLLTSRRSSDNAELGFTAKQVINGTLTTWTGAGDGLVVPWADQSGTARTFSQSTAANQPAIVRSGVLQTANGKPVIDFDGTNDHLRCPAATFITPTTQLQVSLVCKNDNADLSGLSGLETLIAQWDFGTVQRSWVILINAAEKIEVLFGDPADGTLEGGWVSTAAISPINLQTVGFTFNAGTVVLYVNGVATAGSVTSGVIPTSLFNTNADATIGCTLGSNVAGNVWNGQIGELYAADNLLDDIAEIQQAQMAAFNIV